MRIRCRLGIAAFTLAATTGTGFAQVEEIVVTAQRREQVLQNVPLAVSAFRADQVEKLQINTAKDIGENVPNLQTYSVTAGGQAMQVHARGASVQNPGFNISESPVGIYVDDVYRGRLAAANLDLLDVERIEVLRGPQATLYGRNTIAGAIKVVTRTPGDDPWADFSVGYGNFQTLKMGGSVGGPLEEGMLAGSISALYHERSGGWQPNPVRERDVGRYDDKAVRGKLHWYGTENLDAVLTVWAVDVKNDGYNGVPYAPFNDPSTAPFGAPGDAASAGSPLGGFYDNWSGEGSNFGASNQAGFSLDWSWNLGPATLRSITGYANVKDSFGFDLAGGGFLGIPGEEGLLIDSDGSIDTWTQEIQLLGSALNDQVDWIIGGFYLNEDGDQNFGGTLDMFGINFLEQIESTTDSYAAFAEGTWRFTDQWSVTGGVRWTRDRKTLDNTNTCSGPTCAGPPVVSLKRSYSEVTGKLGINFQVNEDLLTYFNWSQGFQAGGFRSLCFGNLSVECGGDSFDPQTVDSFELGLKADLFERTLRMNAAAFYAMYDDIQSIVLSSTGGFPINNIGKVDVYGVELELYWSPVDTINIFAIMGWQESSFGRVDPNSPPGGLGGATEPTRELASNPRFSGRVGFDYTIPLNSDLNFFYGADLNHSQKYFSEARNLVEIPSYSRVNGFIGMGEPDGRWQVALTARNIFNRNDNVSGIYAPGFTNIRTVLPPAEYMMTLRLRY